MRLNFLLSVCASIAGWLCLSATAADSPATKPTPLPVSRIAILGDSFSERGWPSLLQGDPTYPGGATFSNKLAHILPSCVLSNFAVGGAHASGWLGIQTNAHGVYQGNGARMYLTNWPALLAFKPDLTVVYIGGNDFNEGPFVNIQTITDRVGLLIDRLREHNPRMQIVLGCYNDAYDGLSQQAVARDRYTNASIAILLLKDSLEELARKKSCESVCQTIYDAFMNHCWGRDLGGPIHLEPTYSRPYVAFKADQHPGLAGHAELANIFYAKFAEMAGVSTASSSRKFDVQSHYLNFPIKIGAPKRWLSVMVGGKVQQRFNLELATNEPDWWAFLNVSPWKGQTLTVEADGPESTSLAGIEPGDGIRGGENIYQEALRPQLHFSPRRGRNNDPNGLCYYNGEYHLFLQLNPYGWTSGNKYWGHAVSKDLVHWRELDHALTPDALGRMFSGSAAVDWKNTTGFGSAGKAPLVLCYTAAGSPDFVQCLASSTDGRTFTKFDGNPVLNQIVPENRDPKIFWHEPTRRWIMALYIPTATGQTNAEGQPIMHSATRFLSSPNLKQWTVLSSIDSFPECPDLFELPLDGNRKNQKWILSGAAGRYMVGKFDGTNFVSETETIVPDHGRGCYAAQTFNDTPDGRRIQMSWLPVAVTPGMPFNQAMSLPCELKLCTTPSGPRLTWTFVKELESLRVRSHRTKARTLKPGDPNPLAGTQGELLEVRADIEPGSADEISFNVRGVSINFDVKQQELVLHTTTYNSRTKQYDPATLRSPAPLVDGHQRLVIYMDRTLVEVTASDGLTYLPAPAYPRLDNQSVKVSVTGGSAKIRRLEAHELKSSWK